MKKFLLIILSAIVTNLAIAHDAGSLNKAEQLNSMGEKYHFACGNKRDYAKAREYYLQAVELGSASAANHLARLYLNGEGVEKDSAQAEKWYTKSVELDPSLENKCLNGQHSNKILCGLVLSAMQDSAPAQYWLGSLYEKGDAEIEKDSNKAFALYQRAAKKGSVEATHAIARCYQEGIGTERDVVKAKQWMKKAQALENRQ